MFFRVQYETKINQINDILERCVIVLLGSFNPAIFQPEWFLKHSIVPEEEIEGLTAAPNIKEIPEIGLKLEYGQSFFVTVPNDQFGINFKNLINQKKYISAISVKEQK